MARLLLACLSLLPAWALASGPVYQDPSAAVEARVQDLLGRMSLDEKVDLLSGINDLDLRPNARLGIPSLRMTDGPLGVRLEKATAFPAGIAMAASFDPGLTAELAAAIGVETLALGRDMLLGPCVNIARAPQGGRNFESFGEDPYLAARLAEAYVAALQGRKVLASTKHYAVNNQEVERMTVNARVGERALHEIYLPAFKAAVRAGTWTVMAAYNRINGRTAAENDYLLNQVLKKKWDFQGFVVSDWGATHSTVDSALAGLDVEMPSGDFFGKGQLQAAVHAGRVPAELIDDKARRVLRTMFASGLFERKDADRPARSAVNGPEHQAIALRMAREGIVLLKNEGLLPLDAARLKTVAVLGPSAAEARAGGGGSSKVVPFYAVSALEGLRERAGAALKLDFVLGVKMPGEVAPLDPSWLTPPNGQGSGLYAEYFANKELKGPPAAALVEPGVDHDWADGVAPAANVRPTDFSARWTGLLRVPKSGAYHLAVRSDDGVRLWVDGELAVDDWTDHAPVTHAKRLELKAKRGYALRLEYYQGSGGAVAQLAWAEPVDKELPKAVAAAKKADAALVFVGTSALLEGEGNDRPSLDLPEGQDALIEAVAKANPNTVVVVQAGSPVLMGRWADKVKAIVMAWYPGQEGGRALADVLLGKFNPSGKLPVTFPKSWEDSPAYGNYPGGGGAVDYAEGLLVGYRHFDAKKIAPLFPFGHGLSYTSFAFSGLSVAARDASAAAPDIEVSVDVKNTGARAGAEVAQLYVHDEAPKVPRPEAELKGFSRVELGPGETKKVSFRLDREAFAYYDEARHDWAVAPGRFSLRVGASSRDIRLTGGVELK